MNHLFRGDMEMFEKGKGERSFERFKFLLLYRLLQLNVPLTFFGILYILATEKKVESILFQSFFLVVLLLSLFYVRKKKYLQPIRLLFCWSGWFAVIGLCLFDGALESAVISYLPIQIFITGLVLNQRHLVWMSLLSFLWVFFLYYLSSFGLVPQTLYGHHKSYLFFSYFLCFLLLALFAELVIRVVSRVLHELRETSREVELVTVSKDSLERILDKMSTPLALFEVEGGFLQTNEAFLELAGLERTEIETKNFYKSFSLREDVIVGLEEGSKVIETILELGRGSRKIVSLSITPVLDDVFQDKHFLCCVADLTKKTEEIKQLLRAQKAAEAANEQKTRFLETVSHELRTPLNVIIGYAEMLSEEYANEKILAQDVEKILTSSQLLLRLVDEVLDVTSIELGQQELQSEPFSLLGVLRELEEAFAVISSMNQNQFEIKVRTQKETILGDRVKIQQILNNLLSNAFKFTKRGKVSLSVEETTRGGKTGLSFCVEDTGIGISESAQEHLFQAFSQASDEIQRKYGGTGLGLVLCSHFTQLMGGSLQLKSHPGKGTRVLFWFPL